MQHFAAELEKKKKCLKLRKLDWNIFFFKLSKHIFMKTWKKKITTYRIYHMYSDRQAWANSVDPDEMPLKAASHQGLHCLPPIQQFLDTISGSKLNLFKF